MIELLNEPTQVLDYRERAFAYVKSKRLEDANAERRLQMV